MTFILPELPYDRKALEPYISEKTINYHYGKHHQGYINNLNKMIEDTPYADMSIENIIVETYGKEEYIGIYNNAAQAWNHNFFWQSMRPNGGGTPKEGLKARLIQDFGTIEKFKEIFKTASISQFGSGWIWLVEDNGILRVIKTSNADTPIAYGLKALYTLDVWEHSYYLDYQNDRGSYVDAYLNYLINW